MRAPIEIRPASGARDRDAFVRVPFGVFRSDPNWVPPLFFERKEHIDPEKNPYFAHAEAALFLAFKDGEPLYPALEAEDVHARCDVRSRRLYRPSS